MIARNRRLVVAQDSDARLLLALPPVCDHFPLIVIGSAFHLLLPLS